MIYEYANIDTFSSAQYLNSTMNFVFAASRPARQFFLQYQSFWAFIGFTYAIFGCCNTIKVVERDECIWFVDFCWSQYGLVHSAPLTVFIFEKTIPQKKPDIITMIVLYVKNSALMEIPLQYKATVLDLDLQRFLNEVSFLVSWAFGYGLLASETIYVLIQILALIPQWFGFPWQ